MRIYPNLLLGVSSAHLLDLAHQAPDGSNEACLLTPAAVGHAVAVPWPWVSLAMAGLGFAAFAFWRFRPSPAAADEGGPSALAERDGAGRWYCPECGRRGHL